MNVRYQYSRQIRQSPRIILGDNYGTVNNRQYNIAYTATHVFSLRQTGEFRYGFGNRNTNQEVTDSNDIPIIRFGTALVNPSVSSDTLPSSGTVIGTSANVPILRKQRDHQLVYNHTIVFGRHTFRAGVDQRFQALDDVASGTQRGYWQFYTPYGSNDVMSPITGPRAAFTGWEMFLMGINYSSFSFQKGFGQPYAENRFNETNLYAEDSFRMSPSLTLNMGVRWEGVSAPHEIKNRFSYGYKGDYNNFEPRVGIAWSPTWDSGFLSKISGKQGDFVIRAGYGIYHSRVFQSIFSQSGLNYRYQPPNGFFFGSFANPCSGNPGSSTINAPAGPATIYGGQFEVSDPTCGYQFVPGQANYSTTTDVAGVRVNGGVLQTALLLPDKGFHLPYTSQWNLTVERQLPWKMALQVGYNGNRGIGLPFFSGLNDAQWGITSRLVSADVGGGNYQPVVYDRVCRDFSDPICVVNNTDGTINTSASGARRSFSSYSTNTTLANKGIVIVNGVPHGYVSANSTQAGYRRPDPTMGRNVRLSNFAFTYYNAMVVKLTKATGHGLTFSGWWTWSKTMDTGSETTYTGTDVNAPTGATNPQRSLRGLSAFSQKHRFVISAAYEFPWMKNQPGVLGRMLGGWGVSGVTTFASGLPFSILAGYDVNLDGVGGDRPIMADPKIVGRSLDNGHSQFPCPTAVSSTGRCLSTISETKVPAAAFYPNYNNLSGDTYPLFPGEAFPAGQVPRNAWFQQGQKNVDAAVTKNVQIAERFKLNLRFEMYNLFNRVTFNQPANLTVISGATYPLGRISSTINLQNYVNSARTTGARMGQLALRLVF
jgi:hypothetical protein